MKAKTLPRAPAPRRRRDEAWEELVRTAEIHVLCCPHTTASLAKALGVSTATVSRVLAAVRKRGVQVVSVRENGGWHYEVKNRGEIARAQHEALRSLIGFIKEGKGSPLKPEDELIYGDD